MMKDTEKKQKKAFKSTLGLRLFLSLSLQQALDGLSFHDNKESEDLDRILIEMVASAIEEIHPYTFEA